MDFPHYKAKVQCFEGCFLLMRGLRHLPVSGNRDAQNAAVSMIREVMAGGDPSRITRPIFPCKVEFLESLKNVNLAVDLETLDQQAEEVKQEILRLGKFVSWLARNTPMPYVPTGSVLSPEPEGKIVADRSPSFKMTDYIRNTVGKIIYPFDFWEDCIEVYLRTHTKNTSNSQVSREYKFKSSEETTERGRLALIATMLDESERLMDAALQNQFPPKTLRAGKKHTMIF